MTELCQIDKPWITPDYKDLIQKRQRARYNGDTETYKKLRNRINRQTTRLRSKFYKSKVQQLLTSDSRQWWNSVKDIIGAAKSDPVDIFAGMANDHTEGDLAKLANLMNTFFQSVSADLPPLQVDPEVIPQSTQIDDKYLVTVEQVERQLMRVKKGKAAGPDGIQAWMLRDLAPLLAPPVTAIYNSSIREGFVPEKWKQAIVCPLPKKSPPSVLTKDIRPISLTCRLAKELERIVIKHLRT